MYVAFLLLLGASLARFLTRHPGEPRTPWIIALTLVLTLLYMLGPGPGTGGPVRAGRSVRAGGSVRADEDDGDGDEGGPGRAGRARLVWLGGVVATWLVLVFLAPSFAWCAVPLLFTGLNLLAARPALVLVGLLTAWVVAAQLRLAGAFDPNLVLAPPAVAAIATAVFLHLRRQAARQHALIDDLLRTRRELAATERREGTLAERHRLSMEIHDTLAQGLSSQRMLLQAADRVWTADPEAARTHVRTASGIAEANLAEARRFVHDLAPVDLATGGGLPEALRAVAGRETAFTTRCHIEGTPTELPRPVRSALLRIAQGALANVREHAQARTAALTLTYLGDQVLLDIADDGRGFDPARTPGPAHERGHGLPAMRARARSLGGTLTVESAPGDGTVVSVAVPLGPEEHPPMNPGGGPR
ncbi:sensor histidine kinase [Streptomyces sp. I05A-00742]|uniref:sensor histidine kinase n=1 Tax=Streptomyces sp. I05A-00742 TaxID=2732853 RepID=UPI00201794EA|nr:sensor histidine kinase [Streptomyces sp. I05A-00742]